MLALILAATWPLSIIEPEVVCEPRYHCDRMADPVILSSPTRIADAKMVGSPEMWQPFSFEEVAERYPVSTPSPRYTVPIDEAIATNELLGRMKARDVQTRGQLLNQQIAQKQLDYDNNILTQTEAATQVLAGLDPAAPNYQAQKAELVKQYPLAVQNPAFNSLLGRTDQTHQQQMQADEILKRQAFDDDERENYANRRLEENLRGQVAQFGPSAMEAYDKALVPDETGFVTPQSHLRAFAAASSVVNRAKSQALEEKPLTPQQATRMRIDLIAAKNRVLDRKKDPMYTWSDSDQADLDAIQSEIQSLSANPSSGAAQPSKVIPIQSLFPKSSTKTGP